MSQKVLVKEKHILEQDTLFYWLRQRNVGKKCLSFSPLWEPWTPLSSLGAPDPFSSSGTLDFLSTCLGIDSLTSTPNFYQNVKEDSLGGPVIESMFPMQGEWVWSLINLRGTKIPNPMWCSQEKKKKNAVQVERGMWEVLIPLLTNFFSASQNVLTGISKHWYKGRRLILKSLLSRDCTSILSIYLNLGDNYLWQLVWWKLLVLASSKHAGSRDRKFLSVVTSLSSRMHDIAEY